MNLKKKMIGFGATMVTLMLVTVGVAYISLNQLSNAVVVMSDVNLPLTNAMSTVAKGQLTQSAWLERSLLAAELDLAEELENASKEFSLENEKINAAINSSLDIARERASSSEQMERFHQGVVSVRESYDLYYGTGLELVSLLKAGDIVQADSYLRRVQAQSAELIKIIEPLAQEITRNSQVESHALVNSSENALMSLAAIGMLSILTALALSFFITRSVLSQLGADPAELQKIAEHLAEGRLESETSANATGVAKSIATTVEKLREVIRGIQTGAEEVSIASEQVGQGNTNLSQRTQEQASSLEEVAASMEEMTSTVNQNAENANQANDMAIETSRRAEDGGSIAQQAVNAMSEISDSSKRISEIISVIDDISFQINLLALNAAVEAARAGDQGRGFAVVAGEVRNLAGRSATAAKEIADLIQDSVKKVEDGTKLVDETGERLSGIVESIKKVSANVAEIAAASREQSDGIAQVNRAILQMDDMTQQNASLVEEAAAASETVDAQARELLDLVSFFSFGEEEERRVARRSTSRRDYRRFTESRSDEKSVRASEILKIEEPVTADAEQEWEQF